jgi:penicillin-binding protein 1A
MTEARKIQKRKERAKSNKNIFKSVVLVGIAVLLVAGFFGAGAVKSIIQAAPPLDVGKIEELSQTTFFYDQNGEPITEYFGFENRVWATLDEIPIKLQQAFISIEDKRFYDHKGMDFIRLGGAFINNLKGGHIQGASTITQQLVKTLYLTPERSYKRKIQEAYLAFKLENEFSKEEILEAYLNTINFEEGNYGVKAASKDYFGKEDMNDLTLKEMAVLAGLVRNPASYNPRRNYHGSEDRRHITEERADLVLKAMLENGHITEEEYEEARNEELQVVKEATRLKLYEMAPFIEYAIYEVRDAIIKLKGWQNDKDGRQKADEFIYSNGLKIYTTLDRNIQKTVEDTLYNWDGYPNLKDDDNPLPQPQAAAVVMDKEGHVKAVVGGRTPPTNKRELNRAITPVMMGSTIKPVAVFGPALEEGKSPATIYHNIPVKIQGWDANQDFPKNYGGGGYTGPTTMRYGLVRSLNVVSAQALTYDVGFEKSKVYLEGLGIDPSHIQVNGSGLALGTSSITPVELAGAYSAIANGGIYNEPISVLKVVDRDGKTLIDRSENRLQKKVFSESTSWMLVDMMKDAVKSGTGKNAQIPGMTVAGKTGTNSDFKGVAFAGFTPYYTGVVWIGHDEGKSLGDNIQGSKYAAPLWQAFMARIHEDAGLEDRDILSKGPEELGLVQKRVCKISGKLAGQDCPKDEVIVDWFDPRSVPEEVCDRHGTFQVCADSGKLPGPYCPEESISTKAVYFLEAESPYWQLSRDQISKWIPRAYFGFNSLWEINSLDYENPEHANHFCHIHTAPPLPDPGDVWDDSLDKLKEFFEGLMPGNNEEKPRNEESNNGDIEGEDGNNGDNHYDDFDDERVTDVSD